MQWRNDRSRYGIIAQLLHWGIAVLLVVQFAIGWYGARLPGGFEQLVVLARHKSLGLTILAIVLLRLGWRSANPRPALPNDTSVLQRRLAQATHGVLYLLLLVLPLSGWLYSSAAGVSVSWFGWWALPDLVAADQGRAAMLATLHGWLAWIMLVVVALHVAAALWHHAVRRDDVLRRMLPARRSRGGVAVLAALVLLTPGIRTAAAADPSVPCWRLEAPGSSLTFTGEQAGAPAKGRFKGFSSEWCFDPDRAAGELTITVQLDSVNTDNATRDETLRGKDFFDVQRFPQARYHAARFESLGDGRFRARGTLMLHGVSRSEPVEFQVTPNASGQQMTVEGDVTVDRRDFDIGSGPWSDTRWVGAAVSVKFRLVFRRRSSPETSEATGGQ